MSGNGEEYRRLLAVSQAELDMLSRPGRQEKYNRSGAGGSIRTSSGLKESLVLRTSAAKTVSASPAKWRRVEVTIPLPLREPPDSSRFVSPSTVLSKTMAVGVGNDPTFALRRFAGVRIRLAATSLPYRGGESSIEADTFRYAPLSRRASHLASSLSVKLMAAGVSLDLTCPFREHFFSKEAVLPIHASCRNMVSMEGVEPSCSRRGVLSALCIPIPPHRRNLWSERGESNSYACAAGSKPAVSPISTTLGFSKNFGMRCRIRTDD